MYSVLFSVVYITRGGVAKALSIYTHIDVRICTSGCVSYMFVSFIVIR